MKSRVTLEMKEETVWPGAGPRVPFLPGFPCIASRFPSLPSCSFASFHSGSWAALLTYLKLLFKEAARWLCRFPEGGTPRTAPLPGACLSWDAASAALAQCLLLIGLSWALLEISLHFTLSWLKSLQTCPIPGLPSPGQAIPFHGSQGINYRTIPWAKLQHFLIWAVSQSLARPDVGQSG